MNVFRFLKPLIIGISVFLVISSSALLVYFIKLQGAYAARRTEAHEYAGMLRSGLDQKINLHIHLSSGLAAYIKVYNKNLNRSEIQRILKEIYDFSPVIKNLGVAQGYTLKFVYPVQGNSQAVGMDYRNRPDQWPAVQAAVEAREGILDGPLNLVQGGSGLIYRYPVYIEGNYWGLLSTVINTEVFLKEVFAEADEGLYRFVLIKKSPLNQVIYGDSGLIEDPDTVFIESSLYGLRLVYGVRPLPPDTEGLISFLFLGLLLAFSAGAGAAFYIYSVQKTAETRAQYNLIADNVSDVIWILNLNLGKFTYISPSVKNLSVFTPEEALNRTLEESLTKESLKTVRESLEKNLPRFLSQENPDAYYIHELQQPAKDGSLIWVETSTRFMRNKNNEIEVFGVSRNINERKKNEEQLMAVNRTRDKMIGVISHDLRGPVGTIASVTEEILSGEQDFEKEDLIQSIRMIHKSAEASHRLLENLLLWARNQTGTLKPELTENDICETVKRAVLFTEESAAAKSIILKINLPPEKILRFDSRMIETVVRNLLSNAVKFTPRGGSVTVSAAESDSAFSVSVADTGTGLPQDVVTLLSSGQSVRSSFGTDGEKGSGLGLYLCRDFVNMHGGTLSFLNNENGGSTVTFSLPV